MIDENLRDTVIKLIETSPDFNFALAGPDDPKIRQDVGEATKEFFSRYIRVVGPGGHFSRSHLSKEISFLPLVILGDMDGALMLSKVNEDDVYWSTALEVIPELSVEQYLEGEEVAGYASVYHLILDFALS